MNSPEPKWLPVDEDPAEGDRILYVDKYNGIGHCVWSVPRDDEGGYACWWDEEKDDEVSPRYRMPPLPPSPDHQ